MGVNIGWFIFKNKNKIASIIFLDFKIVLAHIIRIYTSKKTFKIKKVGLTEH